MESEPNNINPSSLTPTESGPAPEPELKDGLTTEQPSDNNVTEPTSTSLFDKPVTDQSSEPKKKSKLALIIMLVVAGVLLVGGIVLGAIWLINFQKPENVVLNAITNAIGQKAVKVNGDLAFSGKVMEDSGLKSISITTSSESAIVPSSSETTVKVTTVKGDEFEIKASDVLLVNGVLYFKVDGLADTLKSALPEEMQPYVEYFSDVIDEVDGTWWKMDMAEFKVSDQDTQQYDCMMNVVKSLNTGKVQDELSGLYREWPLLNAEKSDQRQDGYDGYNVSLNTTNAAGFANNFKNTSLYDDFVTCAEMSGGKVGDYEDITAEDISLPNDMPTVTLFIHPWSHELKSVRLSYSNDDIDVKGNLNLEFVDTVNVTAPDNSKSIKELVNMVMVKVCGMMGLTADECTLNIGGLSAASVDANPIARR